VPSVARRFSICFFIVFTIMSISILTELPAFAFPRVVFFRVSGISATVKLFLSSSAIVSEIPSIATEPFGTIWFNSSGGAVKEMFANLPCFWMVFIAAVPSMCPVTK